MDLTRKFFAIAIGLKLDCCIVLNAHNTVFGSKRWAICATVDLSYNVFFKLNHLHISISVPATWKKVSVRCIPARTVRKKSSGIVILLKTYFSFVLMTSSGHAHLGRQHNVAWLRLASDRRRREFGEVSCTECAGMTELIPMVKLETRHPVESYFGNEFP